MESILFSCVWNIMVNAHKQRWARMDGHTGFILISGVHGVLFYAEILPISFAFFVLVSSICTPRNWLLAQLIRCFYGYFLSCLSLMPSLEWKVCNQNQGRYTIRRVVWIHLQGQRSLVTFTAIAGSVDSAGGYRICFFFLACTIPFLLTKQKWHPLYKFFTKIWHLSDQPSQVWV